MTEENYKMCINRQESDVEELTIFKFIVVSLYLKAIIIKGGLQMKKVVSFFIVVVLLLGNLGGNFVFAVKGDSNLQVALTELEKEKDRNLQSIVEQLEAQDMMEHYKFYEELINIEYKVLKNKLEGNDITPMSVMNRRYLLSSGGQIKYNIEPHPDTRTHGFFVIDSYTKQMTADIFREYDRNLRVSLGDISRYISEYMLNAKIPAIGPVLAGIEGVILLNRYLTAQTINQIEKSSSKSLQVVSVLSYGGRSTVWKEWSDNPYVYIHSDAVKVQVTRF